MMSNRILAVGTSYLPPAVVPRGRRTSHLIPHAASSGGSGYEQPTSPTSYGKKYYGQLADFQSIAREVDGKAPWELGVQTHERNIMWCVKQAESCNVLMFPTQRYPRTKHTFYSY
jgi:hypothetical protein